MLVRVSVRSLWDPPRPPCYPGPLPELVITQDKQRPPSPKFVTNGIIDWQTLSFSRAAGLLSVALARRNTFNLIEKHWGCEGGGHAAIGEIKRWDSFNDSPPPPCLKVRSTVTPSLSALWSHNDSTLRVLHSHLFFFFFSFCEITSQLDMCVGIQPAASCQFQYRRLILLFLRQRWLAGWLAGWCRTLHLVFFVVFFSTGAWQHTMYFSVTPQHFGTKRRARRAKQLPVHQLLQ